MEGRREVEPAAFDEDGRPHEADEVETFFQFLVDEQWFLISALSVEAVITAEACSPIPFTPPHVRGVMVHGDRVLGVVDLRRLLGIGRKAFGAAEDPYARTLIVHDGRMRAGLLCDRAAGVIDVERSKRRSVQVLQGERLRQVLLAEVETPKGLAGIVDASTLLDAARVGDS